MGFLDQLLAELGKDRPWLEKASKVHKSILSRMNQGQGGTYTTIRKLAPHLNMTAGELAERYEQYRSNRKVQIAS